MTNNMPWASKLKPLGTFYNLPCHLHTVTHIYGNVYFFPPQWLLLAFPMPKFDFLVFILIIAKVLADITYILAKVNCACQLVTRSLSLALALLLHMNVDCSASFTRAHDVTVSTESIFHFVLTRSTVMRLRSAGVLSIAADCEREPDSAVFPPNGLGLLGAIGHRSTACTLTSQTRYIFGTLRCDSSDVLKSVCTHTIRWRITCVRIPWKCMVYLRVSHWRCHWRYAYAWPFCFVSMAEISGTRCTETQLFLGTYITSQ